MPAFKGTLSDADIANVAAYVVVGRRSVGVQLPPGLDPRGLRAAFLDLDGTCCTRRVPLPTARGAIERLQATGVQCVIATGRMLTSARRIAEQLGDHGAARLLPGRDGRHRGR